jgi:hypothetical protein
VRPLAFASAAALVFALLFGGSSRGGLTTTAADVAALPLLALLAVEGGSILRGRTLLTLVLALIFAGPLLQLIPLPPALWMHLPGQGAVAETYAAAGMAPPWRPLSVSPWATQRALLQLLPPLALFLGALSASSAERRLLWGLIVLVAAASTILEMAQLIDGANSPLRYYRPIDGVAAPGLFANRNHTAALQYCAFPIAAALFVDAGPRWPWLRFAALGVFFLAATIGALLTASRAGLLLAILSAALSVVVVLRPSAEALMGRRNFWFACGGVALAALLLSPAFGLVQVLERFFASGDGTAGDRLTMARVSLQAALGFLPFGAGYGSFVRVYPLFQTRETIAPAIINHAHNDALEIAIEGGLLGMATVAAALFLLLRAGRLPLRRASPGRRAEHQAAGVVVLLLCIHSLADYPLRTPALAALFAVAAGVLLQPQKER